MNTMKVYELNVDGLVGPTHHYAGLSPGNLASVYHSANRSNPQAAATQGLKKMRMLHSMGLKQAFLPPQARPNLQLLHQLGFTGSPKEQLNKVRHFPDLLSICYSASSMWTANAATVSPSSDTKDHRVHFTAANLTSNFHRQQETEFSKRLLEIIFNHPNYFKHHSPIPSSTMTSDEGAANHIRLCQTHADLGVHVFVYGKQYIGFKPQAGPKKYPARQTLEASQAIARKHQLTPNQILFARQNPKVIDQGVFHNDVISVANESVFLLHKEAFYDQQNLLKILQEKANFPLSLIEVSSEQVSVQEAVDTYLFNSQLITLPNQGMILIAPIECRNNARVKAYVDELISSSRNPIQEVMYLDLKQSMQNGGGPACLRLRVPLNEDELAAVNPSVVVQAPLLETLDAWILKHYRNQIVATDLADPLLMDESFQALDELTRILKLGPIYPFQK